MSTYITGNAGRYNDIFRISISPFNISALATCNVRTVKYENKYHHSGVPIGENVSLVFIEAAFDFQPIFYDVVRLTSLCAFCAHESVSLKAGQF